MAIVACTGGGTGGHIYPGLAVAERLGSIPLFWIGSTAPLDKTIVSNAHIPFFPIASGKLRRYFSWYNVRDCFRVIEGFFDARAILKKEKPSILFSKGGFVSVPPVLAAASLRIPICIHESDISPGLATKITARFAQHIFVAYEETAARFPPPYRERIQVCGNPVRALFRHADPVRGRSFLGVNSQERLLVVLGGSQGALEINRLIREILPLLTACYTVVHQTGTAWTAAPAPRYIPFHYIGDELADILAAAELVIGRSGAGTVWECATVGVPMILIPLSGSATRGDQQENARFFEQHGAAVVLESPTASRLSDTVASISADTERLRAMADAALRIGACDSAQLIADCIRDRIKY
ncbi:UDP-N-acetylglucosamine--N-acetylmuramyl-(pentapeptide) pyrophosphoryl-undecaprenol N-acetylglucosamine transferase [Pillotina sp. SPG140]|jgi:UDP-N-acetylglucosamine--N-acetylmuramyl-(pentapeptide) pyrophosphoryl-undecaprenol N-acetylglucosamine transferase